MKFKKRILYIDNSLYNIGIGGSHKSLYTLIDGLDKTKYEPFLLLNQKNGIIFQFFSKLKIPIFLLEIQLPENRTNPFKNNIGKISVTQQSKNTTVRNLFGILIQLIRYIFPMTLKTILLIKKLKIDIIHTNARIGSNQHGILSGRLTRTPIISHII